MGGHKALKDCVIVTAGTGEKDWNNQKLKDWIDHASGTFERGITDETTHLVITKKLWTAAGPIVQDVVARKKNGHHIKVVSTDWLEDSLGRKSKQKEKGYSYPIPGFAGKEDANGNPRSHTGLLKELYLENTELTPAQERRNLKKQQIEDDLVKEIALERERDLEAHISAGMSIPEQAAIFKRGAQKAKVIVASNHHIYRDPTGFEFDVVVTKVDTKHNKNERYNLLLKVWESNTMPHTYGFTTTFNGTKVPQQVNHIIAIGSNLPTALRAFNKTFEEKTGTIWNDRIKVANDRALREQENKRMKKAGLPIQHQMTEDIRFQKFSYYPPSYGPIGEVNDTPPPEQSQEENSPIDLETEASRPASRSQTPAQAIFDAEDLAKFNEAQIVENSAGEKLDPMAAPYDFGPSMSFEELTAPEAIAAQEGAGHGGATQYMDLSSYTPAAQRYASPPPELEKNGTVENASPPPELEKNGAVENASPPPELEKNGTVESAVSVLGNASPPPEPKKNGSVESAASVLGKRQDSPVLERTQEEVKKAKFDPETGEYIIDEEEEEEVDDGDDA